MYKNDKVINHFKHSTLVLGLKTTYSTSTKAYLLAP